MKTFVYHHPDLNDVAVVKAESLYMANQKLRWYLKNIDDEDDFFNYEPEVEELNPDLQVQIISW